jgi:hypothetical protein
MRSFRRHHPDSTSLPDLSDGDTIDLRVPHITGKELLEWGMPGRCPECGGFGYLDRIDLVDEVMHQHCPSCWHHWTVSKADIEVSAARGGASGTA